MLTAVGVFVHRAAGEFIDEYGWVVHTYEVKTAISSTLISVRSAEAAERAFVIGAAPSRLAEYYAAVPAVIEGAKRVRSLVADNAAQAATATTLGSLLEERLDVMARVLAAYQTGGIDKLRDDVAFRQGQQQDADIDRLTRQLLDTEESLLSERRAMTLRHANLTRGLTAGAVASCCAMLALALVISLREQQRRLRSERRTASSYAELATSLEASRRLGDTLRQLTELGEMLQGCRTLDEAATGLQAALATLFPSASGTIAVINASQNLVVPLAGWGEAIPGDPVFAPDDCWALRRGQPYPDAGAQVMFSCKHLDKGGSGGPTSLCVPLMAQGSMLGTLILAAPTPFSAETRGTAVAAAEQVSLAIANLRLQETLRTQSLRDPLTNLFNRRYLEVSLARDLARAIRRSQPLAVLMIDVDHFKAFNDTHGHDAGDTVLSRFGELLASLSRSEDVACRYGGEEFTLVLQEADAANALDRAEEVRRAVHALEIRHRRQSLGSVTVSIGIASYPQHGDTPEQLLKRADRALYEAKHQGRDRVCVADR